MACEKKFRQEIDELKAQIKRMQENERKEKRKLAEEDAIKKISKMEEKISELSKNLATQKQVYLWWLLYTRNHAQLRKKDNIKTGNKIQVDVL